MEHTVEIKKIIAGGKGLGRLANNMVIMVPEVLPGEQVRIQEEKRHSGYLEGVPLTIYKPSDNRVAPPCPFYHRCGGCNLQHGSYPAQLEIKRGIVAEALQRAGVALPPQGVEEVVASPDPFYYRHKIKLHTDISGKLGFHQKASNSVVSISRCLLATEGINQTLGQLSQEPLSEKIARTCDSIEIIQSPNSSAITLIIEPRKDGEIDAVLLKQLQKLSRQVLRKDKGQMQRPGTKESVENISQQFRYKKNGSYTLCWHPGGFFQTNADQNQQLIELVLDLAGTVTGTTLLDLFCGMGNFSVPLALKGAVVTGLEHNHGSIESAITNAGSNNLRQCSFTQTDVEKKLRKYCQENTPFDSIILDPPRQGLGKTTTLLLDICPKKIIYISCDPATLARDLTTLTRMDYRISRAIPVDMFPQTHHIETVVSLEKN